jgi:hypothetical protein
MFAADPKARADLKPGTLYALIGENDWIYYGQVTPEKKVGFFHRRDREIATAEEILAAPLLAVVVVAYPSITRALRNGRWKKIGRFEIAGDLSAPRPEVQWPVGTLEVTVWFGDEPKLETTIDDPAIQDFELMAVWDAVHHIPARLTADFGVEPAEWHVGGPILRERKIKEESAARFPEPWHKLPVDWVPTSVR